nr:cyclic nucleotide-binding domain-containing protein [bacterium]
MSEHFDIVSFLSGYTLFHDLSNPILNSVAAKTTVQNFVPDEIIFNEGDEGNSFHLIISGHVRCLKMRDNEELVLAELGLGEGFGEIALMSKVPRTCTVKALDHVKTMVLNREDFAELYRTLPELAINFDLMKQQRVSLLETDEQVNSEKFSSSHHVDLDYTNLDLLMKLNDAAGGHEQVEHCKETGQLASEMSKILCPMVSDIMLFAGYLHEIGKISIPRDLNIKQRQGGKLTKEEKEMFARHYEASVEILRPNENLCKSLYFLSYLGMDNYKDMPLEAQILKVANDFLEYRAA